MNQYDKFLVGQSRTFTGLVERVSAFFEADALSESGCFSIFFSTRSMQKLHAEHVALELIHERAAEAKARVLKADPIPRMSRYGKYRNFCISAAGISGIGASEDAAWIDAASRLPVERDDCKNCGHNKQRHVVKFGGICVGCPCPRFAPTLIPSPEPSALSGEAAEPSFTAQRLIVLIKRAQGYAAEREDLDALKTLEKALELAYVVEGTMEPASAESSRELFEAWWDIEGKYWKSEGMTGEYEKTIARSAWNARAALGGKQ